MHRPERITRRDLLRAAIAAAPLLAAPLGGCGSRDRGLVIVVGGGLCGLVALDRLAKAGREAVLLEAGTRLGGRIFTVRERFADGAALSPGLRAELGAERVGFEDHGLRALLKDLGIATTPYGKRASPMLLDWGGRTYRFDDGRDFPSSLLEGLSETERKASPLGILHALTDAGTPPDAGDPRTGIEWLRSRGLTPAGERWVRAFVPMPLDAMPAAVFHRAALREVKALKSDLVAGGTDQVVEKLAARHAAAITKGMKVASIGQTERGVSVSDGEGRKVEGSSAIVCLPLLPLRALGFDAGMPEPLAERLKTLEPAHETKLAAECPIPGLPTPSRSAASPGGSPSRVRQAASSSRPSSGPRTRPVWRRRRRRRTPTATTSPTDPLIGAAYAYSKSGTAREGVVRAGRLIFAGADLSDSPGWMEGAVRAAEQAVAAVPG